MNVNSKLYNNTDLRNIFLSEVSIGISANAFLLLFHILTFFFQHRPRPTDLPIGFLALTHLVMLLFGGFMATDMFGSWGIWDDITCKAVVYVYRVLRGLSLCITCLLSVLQAITLSPRSSWLAKFKQTPSCHSLGSLLLLWVFYMAVSSHHIYTIMATPNGTSDSLLYVTESCSSSGQSFSQLLVALVPIRDCPLIGFMVLSSGYMVTLLCRHKKQSQHLHSTSLSPQASPELRATRTILLLMGFFMLLSTLDYVISTFRFMSNHDPTMYCIQIFVANGYAIISPFVFLSAEKRIVPFWKFMSGRTANE
ncbi:vomeronasal type-1 receptor 94-like [Ochotona princeps]|uniref:vomeronasal type-1 receptor 94-like n=1 Tax=Ochotona princeps TaxID=9978 RepID=UPI002714EE45|nr:vomeronasal type-1 receptor 94-like [Ochotona princeps]